jgi:ribosomal protein S18 acetylase RimI-like enzyme
MFQIDSFTKKYGQQVVNLSHSIFNIYERFENIDNVQRYEDSGFVALNKEGEVVGYSMIGIVHNDSQDSKNNFSKSPEFTILSLGVKEEYRRKGVAKVLLSEIRNYFRKMYIFLKEIYGVKYEIYLHVRRNNVPARKLYLKEKFKEINLIENYYRSPEDDAVHMKYNFYT